MWKHNPNVIFGGYRIAIFLNMVKRKSWPPGQQL
jgi:hypothetical protein